LAEATHLLGLPRKHKPGDIQPQGAGSGLDADKVDGLHAAEIGGGGGGDMYKAVYDTDNDGKVDDSEKLNGHTEAEVQDHAPKAHAHPESEVTNLVTDLAAKETPSGAQSKVDTHAALTTGVHGVGAGTIAKIADIATDANLSANAQDAISKRHVELHASEHEIDGAQLVRPYQPISGVWKIIGEGAPFDLQAEDQCLFVEGILWFDEDTGKMKVTET
jgi:hypothetical protein